MATKRSVKPPKKVDTFELLVNNERMYMSSLDLAEMTGKEHRHLLEDIREMVGELDGEDGVFGKEIGEDSPNQGSPRRKNAAYLVGKYRNSQNKLQPVFYLNLDLTITLVTGYSTSLRYKIVKRWRELEAQRSSARSDSRVERNRFTQVLKDHGYTKTYEFANTTTQMKRPHGITSKKKDMTERELMLVQASEYLAQVMLSGERGYKEVNPVCVRASRIVSEAVPTLPS